MRKAFTLIEVNLAMLIMAGGILSVLGMYSLGYRENRQSREDVAATAFANAVIDPLVMALSATNLKWSVFRELDDYPGSGGWGEYLDSSKGLVTTSPDAKARSVFAAVMGKATSAAKGSLDCNTSWPSAAAAGMKAGLVVMHDRHSPVVRISFRATRHTAELLTMPMFYTEVRFQGLPDE